MLAMRIFLHRFMRIFRVDLFDGGKTDRPVRRIVLLVILYGNSLA